MLRIVSLAKDHVGPHGDLVYEFLVVFARFEFALKKCGFLQGKMDDDDAKPNWDTFAAEPSVKATFETTGTPEVVNAVDELLAHPPTKQIVKAGKWEWDEGEIFQASRKAANVLLLVRRVRNNLFHGGKFPVLPVIGPERNVELLNRCLVLLDHALRCSPDNVQRAFEEG